MKAMHKANKARLALRKNVSPLSRGQRAHAKHERGQTIAEFAMVLPILLLLVMGIVTFGLAVSNYLSLTDAVNTAARQIAISRGQTADPCNLAVTTVYAAAPTLTQSKFTFSFVLNGAAFSGTSCAAGAADLIQGANAKVTATYPCNLTFFGTDYAPNCVLTAQTTELVQ